MSSATHRALRFGFTIGGEEPGRSVLAKVLGPMEFDDGGIGSAVVTLSFGRNDDVMTAIDDETVLIGELGTAVSRLVSTINMRAVASADDLLIVHGAVVAVGLRAVVLPAVSTAGKSTAAAAFGAAGHPVGSDELVPIGADGRVVPYPKPIVVGPGSFRSPGVVDGRDLLGGRSASHRFVDPRALPGGVMGDVLVVGAVVLPVFEPGAALQVERLSPGAGAVALAGNAFNMSSAPEGFLDRIVSVVEAVPVIRVTHPGADRLVEAVETTMESFA